jgi:hypothetical protein
MSEILSIILFKPVDIKKDDRDQRPFVACLAEKKQQPFFLFGLTEPGTERTIYHTRLEHAYHYTTDTVCVPYVYQIKWNRLIK